MRGIQPIASRMLTALACGSLQVGMESKQLLMSRGLTRREADNVEARHRRRNKAPLEVAELSLVLDSLDALELMPEQAAHLLRSTPLNELLATTIEGDPKERLWCSSGAAALAVLSHHPSRATYCGRGGVSRATDTPPCT